MDIYNTMKKIIENLPSVHDKHARACYTICTNGFEILCDDVSAANATADMIDALFGEHIARTGYYDPFEDKRNNEVDDSTGWWFVDWDD